jgi:hypothetical protein
MANGWTSERRARQAALIQCWKPWERSTGPKTLGGNATGVAQCVEGWNAAYAARAGAATKEARTGAQGLRI